MSTMTNQDIEMWMRFTESSRFQWRSDPIFESRGEYMFFYGGSKVGVYMHIDKTGTMTLGEYQDAVPHIGDALFCAHGEVPYRSQDEAFQHAVTIGGCRFLKDMVTIH